MTRVVDNVACTVCGCVCDDLRVTVEGGRIVQAEGACKLAEPWYAAQETVQPPPAEMNGHAASVQEAVSRAASILLLSRSPLIYGLSRSSTEGQREAVHLADRIGATIDTTASLGHGRSVMAVQEAGECTCTLGEVKNRADLVIFWGTNPVWPIVTSSKTSAGALLHRWRRESELRRGSPSVITICNNAIFRITVSRGFLPTTPLPN